MDESNTKTVSRRQAVGLFGMGIATAAAGTAIAQQSGGPSGIPAAPTKGDPRSKSEATIPRANATVAWTCWEDESEARSR